MNKETKAILFGAALLAVTGTALAFGGPGNCGQRSGSMGAMGMGGGGSLGGPMQGLNQIENLTSEQQTQLRDLRLAQRSAMRNLRDTINDNRTAIRDAIEDGADAATIQKLAETRGTAVTAMTIQQAEMRKKVDAILTEEQRNSLAIMAPSSFGGQRMGGRRGGSNW